MRGRGDAAHPPALRSVLLAVLAFDGVLSAIAGAFFLPFYLGSVPLPVSAVASGALNAALVWAAGYCTPSARLAALPLICWLVTTAGLTLGGPGGDIVFGGAGVMQAGPLLFLAVGAGPALYLMFRRTRPAR